MIPVPKNQLQVKFNQEKQQLEKYGHVSSLTFEEWLTVKGYVKNRKEMTREQEIEQQTFVYYETCSDEDILKSKAFIEGAKWADKTMIDKVCKWLYKSTYQHVDDSRVSMIFEHTIDMIENFRKAMEE